MDKSKYKRLSLNILNIIVFLIIGMLILGTLGFKRDSPKISSVRYIDKMEICFGEGEWEKCTLPLKVENLEPGSKISLRGTFYPKIDDGIYIRSDYASAKVYFDGKNVFTFGKKENYPKFMLNPATEIHVIEAHGDGSSVKLRIDYQFPERVSFIYLEPPMVGTSKELILERSVKFGASWALSLTQIIGGVAIMIISLGLMLANKKGILFFWLGLFSLTIGLWFYGTNSFSITVFPDTTFLYLVSFIGFSICIIPLIEFIKRAIDLTKSKFAFALELSFILANLSSVLLQLFKVYPLHKSWLFFRVALPIGLLSLAILIFVERFRRDNPYATRFIFPAIILSISAFLEIILRSYYWVYSSMPIFQLGVILFLLLMGILAGLSVKDSLELEKQEKELKNEKSILQIQKEEQNKINQLLAKTEKKLSCQRHDLRHHLAVIMELSGDNNELKEYLEGVLEKIPTAMAHYCNNDIINAVISHYASICEKENIKFNASITVPRENDSLADTDICVVFSNLLENAVEGCKRTNNIEKYINIASVIQGEMLAITMDNSFDGKAIKIGDNFCSSKRNDFGIGISSIRSIAREKGGNARFEYDDKRFSSSVFLRI